MALVPSIKSNWNALVDYFSHWFIQEGQGHSKICLSCLICLLLLIVSNYYLIVSWHCCFTAVCCKNNVCCSGLTYHKFGCVQLLLKQHLNPS